MTTEEIRAAFCGLYAGGLAQERRNAGEENAMPPWAETYWLGRQVVKCPMDLWVYQEIIAETKPDLLIETGTSGGGSAYFFATIMDRMDHGHVVTVDTVPYPELYSDHPRITYLSGDSTSDEMADKIRELAAGKRAMVSLDSLHTHDHVARELSLYADLVAADCYLVVEDTGWCGPEAAASGDWASRAAAEFVASHAEFTVDLSRERHLLTSNHRGWLRRVA